MINLFDCYILLKWSDWFWASHLPDWVIPNTAIHVILQSFEGAFRLQPAIIHGSIYSSTMGKLDHKK
jgi:hypothetical protein